MPASTSPEDAPKGPRLMAFHTPGPLTVAIVGDQQSIHVRRWSEALAERGIGVVAVDLARRGRPALTVALDVARVRRRLGRLSRQPHTVVAVHYLHGGLVATALRGLHPVVLHAWGRKSGVNRL